MFKKNLIFRYFLYALLVATIFLFTLNYYKNFLLEKEHTKTLKELNISYKEAIKKDKQIAELIFFNNLLYNKKIYNIYNEALNSSELEPFKEQLFEHLKDYFYYYKSFGLESINFYFSNNRLFLNMKNKNAKTFISKKESLHYVNSTKKDFSSVKQVLNGSSYVVIKPLLDEQLNHIGAIEIEFNFDYIAKHIERSREFDLFFIYKNKELEDSLVNKKESTVFNLNKNFYLKDTIFSKIKYSKDISTKLDSKHREFIKTKMEENQEFVVDVFYNKQYQMMIFIPLFDSLKKQNIAYMVGIGNSKVSTVSQINKSINYIVAVGSFLSIIIFILIYNIHLYKNKNRTIIKEHSDLLNAIDKYIIMAQTSTNGVIKSVTQAFCDLSGYSKKEIIGQNINIIRHPDISKKFFENMWKDLSTKQKWEGEIKNIDKNGNSFWVKGIIFRKYDIYNNHIGYNSIRLNITDTKQLTKINNLLKEDLSNKLNEIKMRDESLEDMTKILLMGKILDSLSHQWKKPMSTISIELATLKARVLNDKLNKDEVLNIHDKVANELKMLSITLNEFKTFFSHNNKSDKYNLYSVLQESVTLMQPQCDLHDILLTINCSKEIYCYGVFNEIKQIMINLLKHIIEQLIDNEVKNPFVEFRVLQEKNDVIIECIDNVLGKSRDIVEKVFSSDYNEEVFKDAGLNLYIARLLLEKTGAKVSFNNRENESIIYIKLVSKDRRKNRRA